MPYFEETPATPVIRRSDITATSDKSSVNGGALC
ncbi:hypothetical protein Vi05172_g13050 [Venturia inaequalis]|nr:hypothetical protein Vi05172_g13050 [Venturia inaequalis]